MVSMQSIFLAIVTIFAVKWLWSRRKMYMLSWKLPGPFAWPIIGNALSMRNIEDNIYYGYRVCQKYGSPIRLWLGPKMYVLLDNADDIETVLKSPYCLNKESAYAYVQDSLSVNGLFTLEASIWKQHRKLVSPYLGLAYVYGNLPVFNKHVNNLVESMKKFVDKELCDLRLSVNEATCNMILETTLGLNVDAKDIAAYSDYLVNIQEIAAIRMFQPWYRFGWLWKLTKFPAVIKEFADLQLSIFNKIIKQRKEGISDELTIVDHLLQVAAENDGFTLTDVKDESNTVMMAGADTTSLTIATTLLMLAIYPEHQQKVFEEIEANISNANDDITREQVEKLMYTEMCIKESLRIFPMVAYVGRQADSDIRLKSVDIVVPKGTSIAVGIYPVHHNKRYWGENVEEFVPQRFHPDNEAKLHPYCYLPFSGGSRNCVGYKYAMVVMKIALAKVLKNYRLSTSLKHDDIKVNMNINTNFICRHLVNVHKRINK